eukprot:4993507-Alexandrium_andersonii.AAC.1
MAKACTDCGLADCGLEFVTVATSRLRTPSSPAFVGRFGICAQDRAERTPRELRGPDLRPFL